MQDLLKQAMLNYNIAETRLLKNWPKDSLGENKGMNMFRKFLLIFTNKEAKYA